MDINISNPILTPPSPASPAANPLAHLSISFQPLSHAAKGAHFEAVVTPDQVVLAAALLDQENFAIDCVTGVDWPADGQMELVYDYFHPAMGWRAVVRTRVRRDLPEVPSIARIFPGANWHEREVWEFFGIHFSGHPDLKPLLLPDDTDFHPLRKDFVPA
jgi:NADH-quinone oxidoreductase subunit C